MKVVASSRQAQGSSASRRLRRAGKVPGVIYGGEKDASAVEIEHNPLYHALRVEAFHSSILDLEVDGNSEQVLLRDVQWHPYKRQVMHVDFQRVKAGEKVSISVPLHFVNEEDSPAIKLQDAIISHVLTELSVSCLPKDLPEYIEVDMAEMSTDKTVHVSDLKMPNGVEPNVGEGNDPVIATASAKASAAAEEALVAESDAAAADAAASADGDGDGKAEGDDKPAEDKSE